MTQVKATRIQKCQLKTWPLGRPQQNPLVPLQGQDITLGVYLFAIGHTWKGRWSLQKPRALQWSVKPVEQNAHPCAVREWGMLLSLSIQRGRGPCFGCSPTVNLHPHETGSTLLAWPGTSAAWSSRTPPCKRWLPSLGWCWAPLSGNPASSSICRSLICTKQV